VVQQRGFEGLARNLAAGNHVFGSFADGFVVALHCRSGLVFLTVIEHHDDQAIGFPAETGRRKRCLFS